jgi:type IV pilus assembly protein PilN
MIRINLLGVERQKVRKAAAFDIGQRLTLACSLILVAAGLGIGWWYWSLNEESARLDTEIAAAQSRQLQLASLLGEVTKFEARRTQLQQRVGLIEQLRAGQSLPVQVLDHVSRSLPDTLWLTAMDQTADNITIEGRSTTIPALSTFVQNLGNSALFGKPIDIVDAVTEAAAAGQAELIRFTVRAPIAKPAASAPAGASAAAAAAPPGGKP